MNLDLLSMEPWPAEKNAFKLVRRCHQLLSELLAKGHFPECHVVTSVANDKDDNEMIPGVVHRSPVICLTAEENPGKPQVGNSLR